MEEIKKTQENSAMRPANIESDKSILQDSLERAVESVLVVQHPSPGLLKLTGATSLDLLNRMSTNELLDMAPNTLRVSVLTTAHARIIDRILVLRRSEDLLVMTSPDLDERVSNWLRGHIFFQDDVRLSRTNLDWSLWGIYGSEAFRVVTSILPGLVLPDGDGITSATGVIIWNVESPTPGLNLLLDPVFTVKMQELSSKDQDLSIAEHVYEILRIKSGIPQSPNEINEKYIPLELGLWDAVSFSKGCYTGQEIIARMESRGKLARQLVGIQLSDEAPLGSSILHDKRNLGVLTSITFSPHHGWIGLGVVKPIADDETEGTVTIGTGQIEGRITEFVDG
jgi:aminomethyltransferase